uniref:NR LBD domain-containing protein n=1 Tax=Megaselia scalaris TaxID=36166 RepID=T1GNS4_MEGSC
MYGQNTYINTYSIPSANRISVCAVQHERGPRKPKIHPQLHGHPHQLGHHHHQNPHHIPVSLVTNVSASFNYTSHIQTGQPHLSMHHLPHHQSQIHHNNVHPIGFPHLFPPVPPNLMDTGKLSDILPAFDLTGSNSSSGGNSDFYKSSASAQHYSSPSPSNSIQSISSVGGTPSEDTSASPKLNVETTPSATPPPLNSLQDGTLMLTNNNNITTANNNNPGRQNGFLELLLGPDKCQELIQHQMHNSLVHPMPHSLIGMDSRVLSWEMLQETTARLLFMAVRWVKCLVPFQTLSKCDQHLLLQESWKELFLLNLAQWSIPLDLSPILESQMIKDRLPQDEATQTEMKTIQEILIRFRQITPDGSEVGCMKAIALFCPEMPGICDIQPVEMLQDQAQCILSDHVRIRYPRQATRFGRLLLLLPSLRTIRASTIEALFFKETIGNVPIARLLRDMYSMEPYSTIDK